MMNQLNYRLKNRVLWAGTVVFVLLAYGLSVRKTIGLYQDNQRMQRNIALARNAPEQIGMLERKEAYLDELLGVAGEEGDFRKELMEVLGPACKRYGLEFRSLDEAETFSTDEMNVLTQQVAVQGEYKKLVQMTHLLEKQLSLGRLVALRFSLEKEPGSKQEELMAYLYIQSIQKNE